MMIIIYHEVHEAHEEKIININLQDFHILHIDVRIVINKKMYELF